MPRDAENRVSFNCSRWLFPFSIAAIAFAVSAPAVVTFAYVRTVSASARVPRVSVTAGSAREPATPEQGVVTGGQARQRVSSPVESPARGIWMRCTSSAFETWRDGRWVPIFFKGFNLGAAPPGRFPGEFAASKLQYEDWLAELSELGANAVRVYTIHPPHFYEALNEHNSDPGRKPIWLFQGAWCDLPADLDFYNDSFSDEFGEEIRSAVDVVHGAVSLPQRRGHAYGQYSADVSRWVAGYIIGREFEPFAVLKTDELHPEATTFKGECLEVFAGTASECWVARMCDLLAAYEMEKYGQQHPVSFTNWPTLDPITHPTEVERGGGRAYHDEDAAALDPSVVKARSTFEAGFFATFHAYPYYPDFISLDPGYSAFRDRHGPCNYGAYLRDLKRRLEGMPLLVGETGVPTSRGLAHFQPQGLNHGGASETEQGKQNCRLLEDCVDAGTGGVLFFEVFDEWFKDNWLVDDLELPADRDVLWQNAQDAEEFFGILAEEPPTWPGPGFVDWSHAKLLYSDRTGDRPAKSEDSLDGCRDLRELLVSSDSRFLYLRVGFSRLDCDQNGAPDLGRMRLMVGLDTVDSLRGDNRFPLLSDVVTDCGNEFLVYVEGADSAAVLIDSGYNYSRFSRVASGRGFEVCDWPFSPQANSDGRFSRLIVETNRERVDSRGRLFPPLHLDAGKLRYTEESGAVCVAGGDWRANTEEDYLEFRIPWALLNITDPSSRSVLDDSLGTPELEVTRTRGVVVSVLSLTNEREPRLSDSMPDLVREGRRYRFASDSLKAYAWPGWESVSYVERRKSSFGLLSECFSATPVVPASSVRVRVALWPGDAAGAASVSFDDGTASQVEYALPILEDAGIRATFGVCGAWMQPSRTKVELAPGCVREQLSVPDLAGLREQGHEIASHGYRHVFLDTLTAEALREEVRKARFYLEEAIGGSVTLFHYPFSRVNDEVAAEVRKAGFKGARAAGGVNESSPDRYALKSVAVVSDEVPGRTRMERLISETRAQNGWLILMYHNVLPAGSPEARCYRELYPEEPYYVTPRRFRSHMRLLSNSGLYIAPECEVLQYIMARDGAWLEVREEERQATIKVRPGNAEINSGVVLTLVVELPWKRVRVSGSLNDSEQRVFNGRLVLEARAGSEISIHRME